MLKSVESPAALSDLIEIADYLTDHAGAEVAHQAIEAIRQSFTLLRAMPGLGVTRSFKSPELHEISIRSLKRRKALSVRHDSCHHLAKIAPALATPPRWNLVWPSTHT
ncbi:MAG: hypothetical protein JWQ02_2020 [Capsulimonas sp.]|jgi:plasmid stabilization system protein ParE|nr:hypothetical protein [Capsulimonas sp.]